MTLRSTSLRAWIAALVNVLAASVAMFATVAAAAGKAKPEVTAIIVRPIHDAQVVRGDDGKVHVEYDLLVVNVVGDPVTLSSVTVLGPAGKKLGRIDGRKLVAATQNLYTHAPVRAIPSSGAVAVEVDLAVAPGTVPARVTNRIAYTLPAGAPSAAVLGAYKVDGPEVAVDRRPAIVIKQPPLVGNGWLATTACCGPNAHRDLRLAVDGGRIEPPKRSPSTGGWSRGTGSLGETAARTSSGMASGQTCSRSPTEPWSSPRTACRSRPRTRRYLRTSNRTSAATR